MKNVGSGKLTIIGKRQQVAKRYQSFLNDTIVKTAINEKMD